MVLRQSELLRQGAYSVRRALRVPVSRDVTLAVTLLLILAALIVPPLLILVATSLTSAQRAGGLTLEHYAAVLGADVTAGMLVNTVLYAAGSTLVSLVVGTVLAWIVARTDAPWQRLAHISAFVAFAIPGIVKVIGWILLLGPESGVINLLYRDWFGADRPLLDIFSLGGMIFVEGLIWSPVVFLLMAAPLQSMDPSLEEAAVMSGATSWQTIRRVTFRLLTPSALSALLLTFVRAVESFEIPALLGIPGGIHVFTTEIYLRIQEGIIPRYGEASAYSVCMIFLVVGLLIPYTAVTRQAHRFFTVTGKGFRPRRIELGRWRVVAGLAALLLPLLVILPVLILAWASIQPYYSAPSSLGRSTWGNYAEALADPKLVRTLLNSLAVSTASATGASALAFLIAWLIVRSRLRGRRLLDFFASIPLVFPGIVAGVAILRTYLTVPIPIYGTLWILIIAFVMLYLPYAMRYNHAGILQLHPELEESSQINGGSWLLTMRRVVLPLVLPSLFSGWVYVFLITVRELSVALLLYAPGTEVVSVAILDLWENGQVTELAAFSVVLVALVVGVSLGFYRVTRQYGLKA